MKHKLLSPTKLPRIESPRIKFSPLKTTYIWAKQKYFQVTLKKCLRALMKASLTEHYLQITKDAELG